jgi:hypothetical protein
MPPEGQNNSEEKLQRYAKERRERGGEFSLHPATRHMLQGEVTRQFGKAESRPKQKGWWAILLAFPGRLAAGGALAVIALTCLVVWNSSRHEPEMQLAQAPQAGSELSSKRAEDRAWAGTVLDKEQSKLPLEKKKLAPAKPLGNERMLTLNGPTESDSTLATKSSEPILSFGVDTVSITITNSVTAAASYSYQANSAEARLSGASAPAQNRGASGPQSLATDYSTSFRSRSPATDVKTDAVAFGGGLAANRPMLGTTPSQQSAAPSILTRAEPDLAKREMALAEKVGQALNQLGVAPGQSGEVASSVQSPGAAALPATPAPAAVTAPTPGLAGVLSDGIVAGAADTRWRRQDNDTPQAQRFYRAAVLEDRGNFSESETEQQNAPGSVGFRVLDRFAIEQQTNTVRVVDADGSVYSGYLDGATAASDTATAVLNFSDEVEQQKAKVSKDAVGQSPHGYSFRASGSNVTLRRFVEVSGRFIAETNGTNTAGRSSSRASATAAPTSRRAVTTTELRGGNLNFAPNSTNSTAIEGVFQIGKDPQQPFRALKEGR